MHPNPAFRKTTDRRNIDFLRRRSFGALTLNAEPVPLIAHIPFLLSEDGSYLEGHLVRSNPIVQKVQKPSPAMMVVSGGDGYISPDWYGVPDQVPTWNYVAVHLQGTIRMLPSTDLYAVLERLSAAMESRLSPKPVWTMEKMTPAVKDRMMRQIIPFAFDVDQIDGTWKLGQNKPENVRMAAGEALESDGFGVEYGQIAGMMQNLPPE